MFIDKDQDTICSVITPAGRSGVGVIRISGSKSVEFTRKLCPKLSNKLESHKSYHLNLYKHNSSILIDQVLVCCFLGSKSFTGEESVEIGCHGSPVVLSAVMQELLSLGCRVSERGEFSRRAFLNGKLDLTQVEGVLNLIESNSKASAEMAIRQLDGQLSKTISHLEERITFVLANFEASIDFTEEDIDIIDYPKTEMLIEKLLLDIEALVSTFNKGRVINEGLKVALVGKPNVGKSSLLNSLTSQDRAIVSDIPGTTRDIIDVNIQVNGLNIQLIDTAGLRDSTDPIELLGMNRSYSAMESADYVFVLVDSSSVAESLLDLPSVKDLVNKNLVLVATKTDLVSDISSLTTQIRGYMTTHDEFKFLSKSPILYVSSKSESGIQETLAFLHDISANYLVDDGAVIQSARHYELLTKAQSFLKEALVLINRRESVEFISVELYDAIFKLQEVLGKKFDDDVMDRVFKEFCIGK